MEELINAVAQEVGVENLTVINADLYNPSSFPSPEQMGARMLNGQFARMGRLLRVFIGLILREIIWKGIAMRKAGRNNQKAWFICLLIFNTVGILPILYLLFFQDKNKEN